jgi:hypothetical protein
VELRAAQWQQLGSIRRLYSLHGFSNLKTTHFPSKINLATIRMASRIRSKKNKQ